MFTERDWFDDFIDAVNSKIAKKKPVKKQLERKGTMFKTPDEIRREKEIKKQTERMNEMREKIKQDKAWWESFEVRLKNLKEDGPEDDSTKTWPIPIPFGD